MDPLSITSAATGFLSFLGQIGTNIGKIATAKEDEKKAIAELQNQIQYFTRIISDLQSYIQDLQNVPQLGNQFTDFKELKECLKECTTKLQEFVDKCQPPMTKRKPLLGRIKWCLMEGEGKKLVEVVNGCKSSIQLELTVRQGRIQHAMLETIQEVVQSTNTTAIAMQDKSAAHDTALNTRTTAVTIQSKVYHQKIMKWLDVVNVNSSFDMARQKCHPGTGEWFLQSEEFNGFKHVIGRCIWLHGKAGAGKTILRHYIEAHPSNALAYFYFSYAETTKCRTYDMLSSVAAQLFKRIPKSDIPSKVISLYNNNISRPPVSVLLELISCVSERLQGSYIVLDALDEVDTEERDSLISSLQVVLTNSKLWKINILLTSRREPYLVEGFSDLDLQEIFLEKSVVDEDIKLYVSELVETEPSFAKWNPELKTEIVTILTRKSDGMFRWVECQIESLKKCLRPYDARIALSSLPATLDETYRRILLAVPEEYRIYIARILAWVAGTKPPPCARLLAEVVIFEPGDSAETSEFDPEKRFSDPDRLIEMCSNLFRDFEHFERCDLDYPACKPRLLGFSHYSVKEYLASDRFMSDTALTVYSLILRQGNLYLMNVQMKYWQLSALRDPSWKAAENLVKSWDDSASVVHCMTLENNGQILDNNGRILDNNGNILLRECIKRLRLRVISLGEAKNREWEERMADFICDRFDHFIASGETGHLPWNPVLYFARMGLHNGTRRCLARGWDATGIGLDMNERIYFDENGDIHTSLSRVVQVDNWTMLTVLFEHGATDIIETPEGWHSPALKTVLDLPKAPSEDTVRLLLQHGSLVNSPFYPGGTLISQIRPGHRLHSLLIEFGAVPDPEFIISDGLVVSFVGEIMEECARRNDLKMALEYLALGAKIGRPVVQAHKITRLFMCPSKLISTDTHFVYFSWNVYSAVDTEYGGITDERIQFFLNHNIDINVRDCIIGLGPEGQFYDLQFCTALDLIMSITRWLKPMEKELAVSCEELGADESGVTNQVKCHSDLLQVYLDAASVLMKYGAKILPREPVGERAWRIRDAKEYFPLSTGSIETLSWQYVKHFVNIGVFSS
ncbi:hypothetical protein M422DRAFT_264255 [Sphaerobolus stellatus SS14]|uniref:Nephrocystin 3-like N-terminal domain-containing protein n=1 Tax=Sphaerobolus stellatus (strain SS14) TaxID=990650 RepID=A0A0C9UWY0_SPHS4|nr:hypothetical protein M422DRAFT_264255 [Sphaerobolus stellatus SS14]